MQASRCCNHDSSNRESIFVVENFLKKLIIVSTRNEIVINNLIYEELYVVPWQ